MPVNRSAGTMEVAMGNPEGIGEALRQFPDFLVIPGPEELDAAIEFGREVCAALMDRSVTHAADDFLVKGLINVLPRLAEVHPDVAFAAFRDARRVIMRRASRRICAGYRSVPVVACRQGAQG